MTDLLTEIFTKSEVADENGKTFPLHSHTSREQCMFLHELIASVSPTMSLEIGLAYGISTLQILKSISGIRKDFTHIVMDPFQHEWSNIGLLHIRRSGYEKNVKFYSEPSTLCLPKLQGEGTRIQFAYIDSTKVFDHLLVDVHYITRMLEKSGILVLDDCDYPGIRLLARFLSRHPSFEVLKGFSPDPVTVKSRIAGGVANTWLKATPFLRRKLGRIDTDSDEELRVNFKCIAFKKVMDDTRPWNWHHEF